MDLAEAVSIVKAIASVPRYDVVGIADRFLIYGSTVERVYHLYALDMERGERFRISKEPIHFLARTRHSSRAVVYIRDVARGFELSKVFAAELPSCEEFEVAPDIVPQRIAGLGFDGVRVAWSGATKDFAAIYLAKIGEGRAEVVAKIRGREFVTDVNERYVVGYGNLRGNPFSMELFVVDLNRNELEIVTPREGSTNVKPKLFGSKILFASNYEDGDRMKLYTYDIEKRRFSKAVFSYRDIEAYNPVEFVDYGWTDDGRVWAIGKRDGRTKLFIDGKEVPTPTGFISSADVIQSRAFVTHSSLRTPPRILSIDLVSDAIEVLIDNPLPEGIAKRFGDIKFVRYRSFDGLEIPMFVLESAIAPKPGPTVLYPHGGPWWEVADYWSPFLASLVALGYHVIAPNFRGSTGYGEKFRKLDLGDPGGGDLKDVVYARRWAIENGLAREDSVAIVGYSYGGYMTFLALTREPKLWKCGVAGAGIVDWEEEYELADAYFKHFTEILFAGKKELFRERSPITYVENIEAPICIVHPQNDSRCPLKPVMKFVQRLIELNKPFELHVIPDIGHAISLDTSSLLRFLIYTATFLEKCFEETS